MVIYLILFLGLLDWASFMSSRVLMSLYAIELGASSATIGALIALYGLGPLLLSVQAGRVADRLGTYRPIVLGSAGLAVGLAVPYAFPILPALFVAALFIGIALVFLNIALQQLIASLGEGEARTRNVSLQSLAVALGATVGPLLVGLSIDHLGHLPTFLYLSLIVAASCAAWIACRRVVPHPARAKHREEGGSVRLMLEQPGLRRVVVASGLVMAGVDLFTFFMPLYGHALGLSATLIGAVIGAFASATFVVRIMLPWLSRRWHEDTLMAGSMMLAGATFLLFPFVHQVAALSVLSFALGLGLGVGQPLSIIMTYNRAPAGRTGEALGLRFTVINFTHMTIPLVFGTVGAAFGPAGVFAANSALLLGGGYANRRAAPSARP